MSFASPTNNPNKDNNKNKDKNTQNKEVDHPDDQAFAAFQVIAEITAMKTADPTSKQ